MKITRLIGTLVLLPALLFGATTPITNPVLNGAGTVSSGSSLTAGNGASVTYSGTGTVNAKTLQGAAPGAANGIAELDASALPEGIFFSPLGRTGEKLYKIATGTLAKATFLFTGDSVSWDYGIGTYIVADLRGQLGDAGSTGAPLNVALASGAAAVTGDFAFSPTGDYWTLPSGGTITFGASSSYGVYSDAVLARWIKQSGAGTFKIQLDPGTGTFSDAAGYTNVDASNATTVAGLANLTYTANPTRVRFVGLSGTVKILEPFHDLTGRAGVRVINLSKGGASLTQLTQCGAILTDTIAAIQPDCVFFEAKESPSLMQSTLPTLYSLIDAGYSAAEWVFFGSSPRSGGDADQLAENGYVRAVAEANGELFYDTFPIWGSYTRMSAANDSLDGTHRNTWASWRCSVDLYSRLGWSRLPRSIVNGVSGANGFVGGSLRSIFSNSGSDQVWTEYQSGPAVTFQRTTGTGGEYRAARLTHRSDNFIGVGFTTGVGALGVATTSDVLMFGASGGRPTLDTSFGNSISFLSGAPAFSESNGSLALRNDGAAGTTGYLRESGAWNAILTAGGGSGANLTGITGTQVANTPAGTIAATTVQAAVNELDASLSSYSRGSDFMDAAFAPPPADDIPVITQATGNTTALSSPVTYTPYICNTGSAVSNSDGQSDTYIRFSPGTYNTGGGGSSDQFMYGSIKPGGDAQFARWPIIATFVTSASNSVVEVCCYSLVDTNQMMPLIEVGGRLLSDTAPQRTVSGNGWKFTMTFPTAKSRRIAIYAGGEIGLYQINVPTSQSITKPVDTINKLVAVIGDSFANGAGVGFLGGAGPCETMSFRFARFLGADALLLAGIGGTGFEAGGATNAYYTRLSYVLGKSPHVLVVNGSINDGTSAGTIQASVASFLASASSVTTVYVIGTTASAYEANHDAVKAATLAAGRTFIDMRGFFTGTGYVGNRVGDGNNDFYRFTDAVHPSTEGHRAAARHSYRQVAP